MRHTADLAKSLRTAAFIVANIIAIPLIGVGLVLAYGNNNNSFFVFALIFSGLVFALDMTMVARALVRSKPGLQRTVLIVLLTVMLVLAVVLVRFAVVKQIEQLRADKVFHITGEQLVDGIKNCEVQVISVNSNDLQITFPDNYVDSNGQEYRYRYVSAPISALPAARQAGHEVHDSCTVWLITNYGQKREQL